MVSFCFESGLTLAISQCYFVEDDKEMYSNVQSKCGASVVLIV